MKDKDKQYEEAQLVGEWGAKFKNAMVHKSEYTKNWQNYMDAYNGDYFAQKNLPEYKSDLVSNYIFSIIETIRPIMLDNDPKFQAMPRHPDAMDYSNDLNEGLIYEWDREKMNTNLYKELINSLVLGTSVFFLPWNSEEKNVQAIPVSPFNIFSDPLATTVEDAEYIIYASYKNVNVLKRQFPDKVDKLSGGDINYSELVQENDDGANVDNQVLVLEAWTRDYQTFEADDETQTKRKYPNGRVITMCPELGIVLSDKHNPYKDGKFPFVLMKDYDVPGKFWGEGEVGQLLSPQKYMNELNNAILDNAKATANMPWIVDRNSGIGRGSITSRPGLVIRKNPGSEVRRDQAPGMPSYVANAVESYKEDMSQISGVFDTLKGENATGVYTAQGILALQEAGQARIRLKVKLMEDFLGDLATMWYSRMKQFWETDRWVRILLPDGTYDFKQFTKEIFEHDFDVRILAGSTMPVNRGAMLDLMIRLAQTVLPDGQSIVDREAVVEYLPQEVKSSVLGRMQESATAMEEQIGELTEMMQGLEEQLEEVRAQSDENDDTQFDVIEQLTKGLESIGSQIGQLKQSHAKLEAEKKKEDETNKIREESYNSGYSDAEQNFSMPDEDDLDPLGAGVLEEGDPLESGLFGQGWTDEDLDATDDALAGTSGVMPGFASDTDELGYDEAEDPEQFQDDLGEGEVDGLPEEVLEGLEELTDEELALLLEQYPQLADLLR